MCLSFIMAEQIPSIQFVHNPLILRTPEKIIIVSLFFITNNIKRFDSVKEKGSF